jgi:hypothetical protein
MILDNIYLDAPIYNSLCYPNLVHKYWKIFKLSDFWQLCSKSSILTLNCTCLASKDTEENKMSNLRSSNILFMFFYEQICGDNFHNASISSQKIWPWKISLISLKIYIKITSIHWSKRILFLDTSMTLTNKICFLTIFILKVWKITL